jgi:hypothetical protein
MGFVDTVNCDSVAGAPRESASSACWSMCPGNRQSGGDSSYGQQSLDMAKFLASGSGPASYLKPRFSSTSCRVRNSNRVLQGLFIGNERTAWEFMTQPNPNCVGEQKKSGASKNEAIKDPCGRIGGCAYVPTRGR